tara:strand:+ start:546 stop:983 length:438 start_codon:yes stop_codon:yes gene_type:complete
MKKLYFAYGSNLNKGQMKYRCPYARPVGKVSLFGYELVFRGVADIKKTNNPENRIEGGLWEITERCEKALDIYEGVASELYKKITIGGILTYKMTRGLEQSPSINYFDIILEGYHDFGLDTTWLYDAAGWKFWNEKEGNNGRSYL